MWAPQWWNSFFLAGDEDPWLSTLLLGGHVGHEVHYTVAITKLIVIPRKIDKGQVRI